MSKTESSQEQRIRVLEKRVKGLQEIVKRLAAGYPEELLREIQ